MESVAILRVLGRHRIVVALGALLALGAGLLVIYRISLAPPALESRTTSSAHALERVLVNTPTSLVADASARGATSIVVGTTLLGSLLASDEARTEMAKEVGLRPSEIGVIGPGAGAPVIATPLAEQALQVTKPNQPYLITVSADPGLPILSIQANTPDSRSAARLARAATQTLATVARRSPVVGGKVKIERVGKAAIGSTSLGAGKIKALIVAFVLFAVWCIAVIVLDGLGRRRAAAAWEEAQGSLA
jgi:hypothetical protein